MTDTRQADNIFDVAIAGGGMIGASLATALAPLGIKIAVVEAFPPEHDAQPSFDDRATALSRSSQRMFEALGFWDELSSFATPIHSIHVSDRGHFGITRIDRVEEGVNALGYVVENRTLGGILWRRLKDRRNVEILCPATVTGVTADDDLVTMSLEDDGSDREIATRLLVAADGARSKVRDWLGIETVTRDYGQVAIIANVRTAKPHDNRAYERFTDTGPLAFLPMSDGRSTIVWTVTREQAERLLTEDDGQFLAALQDRFGYRLGRLLKVGKRQAYPLYLVRAVTQTVGRALVVGNASQGLHPIAGQGFNLGLRDVACLAELITDAHGAAGKDFDPGGEELLDRYARLRRDDRSRIISMTDGLVRLFTNPLGAVRAARNLGLIAMDLMPGAKTAFARRGMGLAEGLPKLARGVPLQ